MPYLHHKTHLPIVVDPSHGTGHTYLVPDMAVASIAAGADGVILRTWIGKAGEQPRVPANRHPA